MGATASGHKNGLRPGLSLLRAHHQGHRHLQPLNKKKSYNQNLLYQEISTRSGSHLVLHVPINFYSYTCNNIYELIVSLTYKTFLFSNLLYQVMSTRSGST